MVGTEAVDGFLEALEALLRPQRLARGKALGLEEGSQRLGVAVVDTNLLLD